MEDGCFWISFSSKGRYSKEWKYRLPFSKSDWRSLGILYGITFATSLDRYHSLDYLWKLCQEMGWKSFDPWNSVQCNLTYVRSYGMLMWMYSLSLEAIYLQDNIRKALKENLGENQWKRLAEKMDEWKERHKTEQHNHEEGFVKLT